jgi:hypothetical protein
MMPLHLRNSTFYLFTNKRVHIRTDKNYINDIIVVLQEGSTLKHAAHLTPTAADEVQDFFCIKFVVLEGFVGTFSELTGPSDDMKS